MTTNEIEWWNLKAGELRDLATRDAIVLIPVGSTEQHGPHLPVQVDALLAGEVARRAARLVTAEQPKSSPASSAESSRRSQRLKTSLNFCILRSCSHAVRFITPPPRGDTEPDNSCAT